MSAPFAEALSLAAPATLCATLSAQVPEAWAALPEGTVVLSGAAPSDTSWIARWTRDSRWRASLDPPRDHPRDLAAIALAGEAARRLAHDLQTPLGAVAGRIELIEPPTEALDLCARRLFSLGALQAVRAQRFPRAMEALTPHEGALPTLVDALQREFQRHGAALSSRLDPQADRCGDATQSALLILVENALSAIQRGGREAHATVSLRDEAISLCVTDDGPGLDPSLRAVIGRRGSVRGGSYERLGLWTLAVIVTSLRGALALSPRAQGGLEARVILSAVPAG